MTDDNLLYEGAEEELRQRNRELALLNRASRVINATLDLDQVLAIVLEEVRELMGVAASSVWLIDPLTGELVCQQATGPRRNVVRGWRLAPGEGIAGWVARHGESLIIPDALADERHSRRVGEEIDLTVRSILSVPLTVKQRSIGVLQVVDTEVDRFSRDDLILMEMLSASAAIAIDNARLVKALRRRTDELEARNVELERLTYVASHHLRSPMVTVQGFASELRRAFDVIEDTVDGLLPCLDVEQRGAVRSALQEDVPEALKFIDISIGHMARLVSALLKLSRLSRAELALEQVDVESLVQQILQTMDQQIEERQVEVIVEPLPNVIADRPSMELIITNLLNNAMLYLSPGRPGKIEITSQSNRDEHIFHIRDNGRGIAKEDMYKVFAPFRRAGDPDVPGEGMGLVYVQTLVRRHGGRIWCEAESGCGTKFTFTISRHLRKGSNHA